MMRQLICFLLFIGTLSAYAQEPGKPKHLNVLEFKQAIEKAKSQLIDVRRKDEFNKGHLPYAQNYNWEDSSFLSQLQHLDKQQSLYLYCVSGKRSIAAAKALEASGFSDVQILEGGISKWREQQLPEVQIPEWEAKLDKDKFKTLLQGDKLVLVDFYAQWCAPCKIMEPYLYRLSQDDAAKFKLLRIDIDEEQHLARKLRINSLPALKLYKKGKVVWQKNRLVTEAELKAAIEAHAH